MEAELTSYPEYRQLLAAVLAMPDDDTPRLVLADWLQEHSCDERAEFIRAQVELAAGGMRHTHTAGQPGGCRLCRLRRVQSRYIEGPGLAEVARLFDRGPNDLWYGGASLVRLGPGQSQDFAVEFARGFVYRMVCTWDDYFRHAAAVFSQHPVEDVRIIDAMIFPSGGNDTYYVGGLGMFPQQYWRRIDRHRSRDAAADELSRVCVHYGRELAGLPPLPG